MGHEFGVIVIVHSILGQVAEKVCNNWAVLKIENKMRYHLIMLYQKLYAKIKLLDICICTMLDKINFDTMPSLYFHILTIFIQLEHTWSGFESDHGWFVRWLLFVINLGGRLILACGTVGGSWKTTSQVEPSLVDGILWKLLMVALAQSYRSL